VCCKAPWRATLEPGESTAIAALLQDHPRELARWQAALDPLSQPLRLRQPGGACALLDAQPPACSLQATAGLAALPSGCRNFPRSVVRTPLGLEVAFTLACPTVAATVTQQVAPFAWAGVAAADFAYPAVRTVGLRILASRASDLGFAELQALREGWWRRLRLADPGESLAQVLAALASGPLACDGVAGAAAEEQLLREACAPLSPAQVRVVTAALQAAPGARLEQVALRKLWVALLQPADPATVLSELHAHAAVFACAAGLAVQHAGVHDGGPLADGLVRAARGTVQAAALRVALVSALGEGAPAQISKLALLAAANLARVPPSVP